MAKLRSISTAFWSDPYIEDLSPSDKLLFIYLITNEKTNMLGIYEASISKISFETGIDKEIVINGLKGFERDKKVRYENNYVILVNYLRHQNFNTNMMKSAIDVYNDLPKSLKIKGLNIDRSNPSEGFETLSNGLGMVRKIEVEDEVKIEVEDEVKNSFSFEDFWKLYPVKIAKEKCKIKFNSLTKKEVLRISETLNFYISHKPFKDYIHPNPYTYLHQKRFDDEPNEPSAELTAKQLIEKYG